jgi:hypothetical protein
VPHAVATPSSSLEFIEAGAALTGSVGDVAIGDAVADANDHALV